jgi:hypothetical protein
MEGLREALTEGGAAEAWARVAEAWTSLTGLPFTNRGAWSVVFVLGLVVRHLERERRRDSK